MMSRAALLIACLVVAGCAGSSADSALPADAALGMCGHAAGLSDGGPHACVVGKQYVTCDSPSGRGCACVTDDASCADCAAPVGSTCQNNCEANEYALGCGGLLPGDASFTAPVIPPGCHVIDSSFSGEGYYCCPCR